MNITLKAASSRTVSDLDARIREELDLLNDRLHCMENCLIELSPVRSEVSVQCKVGNTSNPDRIDLPPDSIVFAYRKSRWGMYYKFATGNGDQVELRDISQMSVAQRIQAVEAFEPLVEAMIESRLARLRSIQSANTAASDAIQQLAKGIRMNIHPKDRSARGDYERAEHRRREMTREELDTARVKYMQILNDIVARQYAKWPDEWKQAVPISEIAFATLTDHQVALCDVLPPQSIEETVRRHMMWDIEYYLSMAPVIACREGKHPSCINGQPYDPRYQNPDTSPRKATT